MKLSEYLNLSAVLLVAFSVKLFPCGPVKSVVMIDGFVDKIKRLDRGMLAPDSINLLNKAAIVVASFFRPP
ncbi:MAG: hypothetical protein EYX74_06905 [Desulfobulbaceae bacterium]|nr:MAG: hypothetical protein EYX74_06905 [Desulfobulbaceae bacterium]